MFFAYQQTDGGPAGQPPKPADELQFGFDVVNEQRHVAVQIELGHFEYERITQDGHAAHSVHLRAVETTVLHDGEWRITGCEYVVWFEAGAEVSTDVKQLETNTVPVHFVHVGAPRCG